MADAGRTVCLAILLIATMARGTALHAMGGDDQTVRPDLRLQAVRSSTPIVTDGTLDEEAWKKAPVASNFVQTEPHQGNPATEQTEVRVLYDDEYLYIGVIAFDAEPERIIINQNFNVSATLSRNDIDVSGGRFTTTLLTGRANYNFSTRMFLNALWQYNADARQWSSNIRFNLIHRALSDVFLVYNERRDSRSGDLVDRAAIAKLTYMMAF